ncbi:hypothetical protein BC629DRAFT_1495228 [Irpex lacteus]|nr:hypothetical protein BC629DRAFT_1495228 [Irpex lacteus]
MPQPSRSSHGLRALSLEDKFEMLNFFEQADHQHLRAVLVALTIDSELGPFVLQAMKRDVLPYMETGVASLRMIHKVKRLADLWNIPGYFSGHGDTCSEGPKRCLDDAPLWKKAYRNLRSLNDPDTSTSGAEVGVAPTSSTHSTSEISFDRFFQWNANQGTSETPQLSTPRMTKKRKIRDSTTHAASEVVATPVKPLKQSVATSLVPSNRKSPNTSPLAKRPAIRTTAHKENERAVPVEGVARRVLERSPTNKMVLGTLFSVLNDCAVDDTQPSRPENPVASVLAQRSDNNNLPSPKRNLATPKPKTVVKKSTPSPATERKSSLRSRVPRPTNS